MNFRNVNEFNVVTNALSGNFFPLTEDKKNTSLGATIYVTFTWIVEILYATSLLTGLLKYVSTLMAFKEGSVFFIAVEEIIILTVYINSRRDDLRNLIGKFNDILIDSDDFRRCVRENVEPNKKYLKLYMIAAVGSVFGWALAPIFKIINNDRFTYVDYTVTAYLPGEPFNIATFLCGVFLQVIGGCYITLKKISIDIYISYIVTLLTAEYKYIREQIASTLRQERNSEKDEISVIVDLKKCVRHQCAVIETGQMFVELMAVLVGLTYINSILRFCCLGFTILSYGDNLFEQLTSVAYGVGALIQVFMLCTCAQQLLEASTSMTDDAFHENWHGRGKTVRNIFSTIGLSNQIQCRMTAHRTVALVTPTVALILNKAYSACLLLRQSMN